MYICRYVYIYIYMSKTAGARRRRGSPAPARAPWPKVYIIIDSIDISLNIIDICVIKMSSILL